VNTIDLEGQTAVVTGGASGIGRAVAQRLCQSGARVAIWDLDAKLGERIAAELGKSAGYIAADITNPESVVDAVTRTEKALGPIDILVNSAGVTGAVKPVDAYPISEWHRIMNVNLNGTFYVNRAVVPGMRQRNYGRICNIASIAGKEGNADSCAYSASKGAVIAFTKSLGKELAGYDIAVNCVTPAAALTPLFERQDQAHKDFLLAKIPRCRFVGVEEIASMIAWMVSRENSFTTAGVFDISGGRATY